MTYSIKVSREQVMKMLRNIDRVNSAFYLPAVKERGVCPILLKTDCGPENVAMAGLRSYLTKKYLLIQVRHVSRKLTYSKLVVIFSTFTF